MECAFHGVRRLVARDGHAALVWIDACGVVRAFKPFQEIGLCLCCFYCPHIGQSKDDTLPRLDGADVGTRYALELSFFHFF